MPEVIEIRHTGSLYHTPYQQMFGCYTFSQIVNEPTDRDEKTHNTLTNSINTLVRNLMPHCFLVLASFKSGKRTIWWPSGVPSTTKEGTPQNGYAETWIFGAHGTS